MLSETMSRMLLQVALVHRQLTSPTQVSNTPQLKINQT
jgi:hypothetical protein